MLFAGTTVVAGTAVAVVTAVGADTQAASRRRAGVRRAVLRHRPAASAQPADQSGLPGQHGRRRTGRRAGPVAGHRPAQHAVASGIAIAVAAVPEGMPLVATLAQAASARRLTKFGALVRVPRSVEALGRIDVVCFDKTGTLSENRLRVSQVHPAPGYSPRRGVALRGARRAGRQRRSAGARHRRRHRRGGVAALRRTARTATEADAHLPFRSGRSFSASVTDSELTVKGAPEVVLAACGDAGSAIGRTRSPNWPPTGCG